MKINGKRIEIQHINIELNSITNDGIKIVPVKGNPAFVVVKNNAFWTSLLFGCAFGGFCLFLYNKTKKRIHPFAKIFGFGILFALLILTRGLYYKNWFYGLSSNVTRVFLEDWILIILVGISKNS